MSVLSVKCQSFSFLIFTQFHTIKYYFTLTNPNHKCTYICIPFKLSLAEYGKWLFTRHQHGNNLTTILTKRPISKQLLPWPHWSLGYHSQGSETVINKIQNSNKCQSACIEVLICIYKQTDDECFYLWDTIRINFKWILWTVETWEGL